MKKCTIMAKLTSFQVRALSDLIYQIMITGTLLGKVLKESPVYDSFQAVYDFCNDELSKFYDQNS